ncbi:MAG: methylmalonyl Co-A mutase-associated GTPase MeaB, partial [Mycobacterium sp.]
MTIDELIEAARGGSTRAAGRLLSLVESRRRGEVLDSLGAVSAPRVVGVTGPPGAGKSTTVGALVSAYRERELRVAVLAVDPSSPYSGGAEIINPESATSPPRTAVSIVGSTKTRASISTHQAIEPIAAPPSHGYP